MNTLACIWLAALLPVVAFAQAREPAAETRVALGGWLFRPDPDDVGLKHGWHTAPADDEWKPVGVPGYFEEQGMGDLDGVVWYRCEFELPPVDGKRRGICIMSVDDVATVFVNGAKLDVDARLGRKAAFDLAAVGRTGKNLLALRVVDHGASGGIPKPVYLGEYERLEELGAGEHRNKSARPSHDWIKDAIIYEIYLRSFSPEGTFKGAEARLDELQKLGVTIVWLMPIHPLGELKRKGTLGSPYSVRDYYAVNPEFGTLADLKSFLRAAHARGMKVILDWVANHTSWDNPLLKEHPDWFARDKSGEIRPPVADWSDVAQLDYSKPAVRAYMTEVMLYWVRDVDIDGFRCDVAGMVPRDFWEALRPKLDAIKPVFMLAEDDDPAQHLLGFDMTYDWETYDAIKLLGEGKTAAGAIPGILASQALEFPRGSLRMRFKSNHDKNAWDKPAMTRYGIDGAKLAAALAFTLPGVPLIYTGDEIGNSTVLPLFEKVSVDWSRETPGMRELYESLGRARREHVALRRGEIRFFESMARSGIVGFSRFTNEEIVFVILNFKREPVIFSTGQEFPTAIKQILGNFEIPPGVGPRTAKAPPLGYWIGVASQ